MLRSCILRNRGLKKRMHQLESELGSTESSLKAARTNGDLRKYMDTRELMRRDKQDARLQLHRIGTFS